MTMRGTFSGQGPPGAKGHCPPEMLEDMPISFPHSLSVPETSQLYLHITNAARPLHPPSAPTLPGGLQWPLGHHPFPIHLPSIPE